jgi:predicted dithiol-disulfide oxidoreductase (DUF899 family)
MVKPHVVSRSQWRALREELLEREKQLTRARDALNEARRKLPWVRVDEPYRFHGPCGVRGAARRASSTLLDLFAGRRQLIVVHTMFFTERDEACTGCSLLADSIPELAHLHARDTTLVMVSRAELGALERFEARMGWRVPWYSSLGSTFNYDFHVTNDEALAPVEYNYRDKRALEQRGLSYHTHGEQPGVSVFVRDGGSVFHTYSTYARGLDTLVATYHYLDLTPFGRGEGWGGMPDVDGLGRGWLRHHDRYE